MGSSWYRALEKIPENRSALSEGRLMSGGEDISAFVQAYQGGMQPQKLSKEEMIAQGADGYLSSAYRMHIPLGKIVGREPVPEMEGGYHKGTKITQPVEVEYNRADDTYTLYAGNHRVRQAEVNRDTHVPAFVQASRPPRSALPAAWKS